jgi:hypothetical protein
MFALSGLARIQRRVYDGTRFWLALDLGVGLLSGLAISEARRGAMLSAVAPIW